MTILTVSSKYQIVIPAGMRESLGVRPRVAEGHQHQRAKGP
jgi:bifunctional DNA-binding transcriptional regulator/antitoxin component of YhaV-PrlF toxin-antitoxin module